MRPSMLALPDPTKERSDEKDAREVHERDATHRAGHPIGRDEQQHPGQQDDQVDVGDGRYPPKAANRSAEWPSEWACHGHTDSLPVVRRFKPHALP